MRGRNYGYVKVLSRSKLLEKKKEEGDYYRSLRQKKNDCYRPHLVYLFILFLILIIVSCLFLFLISNMGSRPIICMTNEVRIITIKPKLWFFLNFFNDLRAKWKTVSNIMDQSDKKIEWNKDNLAIN